MPENTRFQLYGKPELQSWPAFLGLLDHWQPTNVSTPPSPVLTNTAFYGNHGYNYQPGFRGNRGFRGFHGNRGQGTGGKQISCYNCQGNHFARDCPKAKVFYGVRYEFTVGVFDNWEDCNKSINGFSGPVYKKFGSLEEAKVWVAHTTNSSNNSKEDNVEWNNKINGNDY